MISRNFSMQEFLTEVKNHDYGYVEIIRAANREADTAEGVLHGKTREDALARGGRKYVEELGAFIFFMRFGKRPDSATEDEFQAYRPLCEALVAKGQFKPSALDMFKRGG